MRWDLSKAFDCIDQKLLVAKLSAYGRNTGGRKSLELMMKCYRSDSFQRTKISSKYSGWLKINIGVPQGSLLGTLPFNIFHKRFFFWSLRSRWPLVNVVQFVSLLACNGTVDITWFCLKHHAFAKKRR